MTRLAPLVLATAVALTTLGGVASPASAALPACKKQSGELTGGKGTARAWVKGGSVYVCNAFYGDQPTTKKVGPWSSQSRYAFKSGNLIWTVRANAGSDAGAEDLVWAADGPFQVWLKGLRLTTGPTSNLDRRVKALTISGNAAGWVTTKGTVMAAVQSPDSGVGPELIGAGTPGAAAPVVPGVTDTVPPPSAATVLGYPQGLSAATAKPSGHRFLVGRWSALPNAPLASTLKIEAGESDGDECGGSGEWRVTVQPVAGAPRVGASWSSSWTSHSAACAG